MKKISEFSVNYPITISMLALAVILIGYISFTNLGMDLFPDLNNPRIFIEIKAGERPPEEMERQFVENMEAVAIRQKKVIDISSTSQTGMAQITVEYAWDADMDEAFLDLQKSLAGFTQNTGLDELTMSQHDPNSRPVVIVGLAHPDISDMDELRKVAENYLRNELTRLEGIAAVEILGAEEKEVVVETSPYLMDAHGLDLSTLAARIQNSNAMVSGGSIVELGLKYVIKGIGEFQSIEDIRNVIVAFDPPTEEGGVRVPVFLKDVADVYHQNKEPENIVRIDGRRSIALAIYKETRYNTVRAVGELMKNLDQLRRALPGYEFTILENQASFIDMAISEVEETALIGILLAVLILYLFLRRFETTAIIAVAIPVSIIATFNLMYFNGLTVNIMTLGGLALGAGMLVDNAIVVMENIFRNRESGLSVRDSAVLGTSQVAGAITASTLTTIVVFLPIVYLHGAAGELFRDQAWTVAFSLLSSLAVAVTIIPMLSHRLLKPVSNGKTAEGYHFNGYRDLLRRVLHRRWLVIGGAAGLVLLSLLLIPFIGSEFMPQSETDDFQLEITLAEGTALEHMDRVTVQVEEMIRELIGPNIERIYSRIGSTSEALGDGVQTELQEANTAVLTIYRKPDSAESTDDLIVRLNSVLSGNPDWEIAFRKEESSLRTILGTDEAPVVVEVKGEDLPTLRALTAAVKTRLETMNDLFNVESSFDEGRPEVNIVFDRIRAGVYNIDFASVGTQLQETLQGKTVGDWDSEGEMRDITIKQPELYRNQLKDIFVTSGQSRIRLDEIARIEEGSGEKKIDRRNQVRVGQVMADIRTDRPLDQVTGLIREQMKAVPFPQGYQYEITGQELKRTQSFSNLKFALILSIILIYMVMASQFESLIHPFTILLTIPLAVVGAVLIFFILQIPLNVMAYIGIIMLVGIAVNDSIILVDAINQLKRDGMELEDAIVEAGRRRIRPIIMTSLTTILALMPLTIGFGESASLRAPMALAVIGGLTTSTLMTLVVIPCVYYVFEQLSGKLRFTR